tara:strand:- start:5157 stop:6224 length:1068 start_codon:yes stop_codon:yes gene_type:complete
MQQIIFIIFLIYSGSLLSCEPFSNAKLIKNKYAEFFKTHKTKNGWFVDVLNSNKSVSARYSIDVEHSCDDVTKIALPSAIGLVSTTYFPFVDALGMKSSIKSVFGKRNFFEGSFGKKPVNDLGSSPSVEKILKTDLSTLFGYSLNNSDKDLFHQLFKFNYPIFIVHEFMEQSPLAKAEWLKVFGIVFRKFEPSEKIFLDIEKNYNKQLSKKNEMPNSLKVLVAQEYEGNWYIPGENSYIYKMLDSLGVKALLSQGVKGRKKVSRDQIIKSLEAADIWLPQSNEKNAEKLFKYLGVSKGHFKNLRVFNITNKVDRKGSNDFWQTGALRADYVLNDLRQIMSSNSESYLNLKWYEKL